ncbi:cysteine ABC transporter substrate-binding protein [Campylobacter sp. RM9344]|uniref:Cysteine ABC transporter substrate-binding protein n=1 Tax=Campylobacter californiensis TaxID=1032243 RepID=A0AAW3ZR68_9BACT|nr:MULTISPECIES: cysteine ABC transporter substrate-binding protein [unclassified Campylobacter]MBE2983862.1 cysteine ABC transporter substrate-binding protein [Campylobacter sp. RM6883]MBE2985574.1 cysteine ABC transporter substrate-binding protein [Campylobacter sp. RM12919]MBE2987397.1 cysteine ABC transporter substrate-binding protein [Campylobacter sp. RM12920]MBE2994400.1 cysteine ABC transporter substrate-binding protein [Campylobacter sp. RM6913]MBE3028708.1 cysteine ABC transporter su
MKKIIFSFLALIATVFLTGCGNDKVADAQNDALAKIKEQGFVRIGVFSDKPPFGYIGKDGKNEGYDVYFAKRIAKDLLGDENKVKFELVEAASRAEFLVANKVDIILANFTKTPERAQIVDFALPYMKVSLGIVSPDGAPIKDISELKGKKLIVNKGTTADAYFTKNHPDIELLKFDQNTETFGALLDGRGAALAHDNALLFAWAKENPGFKVGVEALGDIDVIAPAVRKGNKTLLEWINNEIAELAKENFFHKAYDATLKPIYGDSVNPESLVVEGGKL